MSFKKHALGQFCEKLLVNSGINNHLKVLLSGRNFLVANLAISLPNRSVKKDSNRKTGGVSLRPAGHQGRIDLLMHIDRHEHHRSAKGRTDHRQYKNKTLRYFLSVFPGAPFLGGPQTSPPLSHFPPPGNPSPAGRRRRRTAIPSHWTSQTCGSAKPGAGRFCGVNSKKLSTLGIGG